MKTSFTVEHFLSIQRPSIRVPLHLSPDGRWLTLSVQSPRRDTVVAQERFYREDGVPVEMIGSRVLVVDTVTGEYQEPFPAGSTSWGGQWSDDGSRLAAYVQHEGMACLGTWDREADRTRLFRGALVHPFFGFEVPQWTPDGRGIAVKLLPESAAGAVSSGNGRSQAEPQSVIVRSFDPAIEQRGGGMPAGFADKLRCDLGLVDVATGRVTRLVRDWPFTVCRMAPDGRSLALLCIVAEVEEMQQFYFDLMIVPLDGAAPRRLTTRAPEHYGICFNWSPDGRRIAYKTTERGQPGQLYVVSADGSSEPRELTGDAGVDVRTSYESPLWSADGEFVYSVGNGSIWRFAVDGSSQRDIGQQVEQQILCWVQPPAARVLLTPDEGAILVTIRDHASKQEGLARIAIDSGQATVLALSEMTWLAYRFGREAALDGSACYLIGQSARRPPGLWRIQREFHRPRELLSLTPDLGDVALGEARVMRYRTLDGKARQAALLLPPDYREGERCPLVVWIYGGSLGSNRVHQFSLGSIDIVDPQVLAGRGYAVLHPDMPMEDHGPLRQMPGLVLPAVNRAIDLGIADPERLGLMGHSYGGYCVLALLTQTTVFRAALASTPAGVNMTSYYTSSIGWCESGQAGLGGTLWDRREAYIENSPLFYLDRVRTPVLLVCGVGDQQIIQDNPTAQIGIATAHQALETFGALRRLEQRVELRLYAGEGHWPGTWSEGNLRDLHEHALKWFDTHLNVRPDPGGCSGKANE